MWFWQCTMMKQNELFKEFVNIVMLLLVEHFAMDVDHDKNTF